MAARIAVAAGNTLGEGPHWDAAAVALYWVDIVERQVWRWHPASDARCVWPLPESVSAVFPRRGGGLLVTLASGIAFLSEHGAVERWVAPDPVAGNRANDARCDAAGRLWLGTMQNNIGPQKEDLPVTRATGGLFRIDPDGTVTRWAEGVGITNALAFSPDGKRLTFADSEANRIDIFDVDPASGTLANRRRFVEGGPGVPDGGTMDAEGCLWNARFGASRLIRYRPDGSVEREVPLPCAQPTSCVFGGPDLRTLYITSARVGMAQPGPADGALLELAVDVPGLQAHPFAG
ncbi:SMP-30/gluconolactonase/LRE family protein [Paracraurococcus lichenis]|uniref:SMP-30/gluconolactonase/LRE family protein n=1 Tax=Paracraurococcus lichenis TaxID=3064888 RepID=A0ABT9E923_9PROT|nr:SMP-30/gluconolactonase/LRE family protein [Paracraurococcus sp. LOR1-02]MDO9712702.1 SMP-30/gluconolactonase/LRE family protein [Paracraurococcus sp. LOR1-02]